MPDSIPAALLARRPDVQQAERNYAAATARIGVADAARLPTISIVGSFGARPACRRTCSATSTHVYQLFAGISFPLFDNGRLANQSAAARARAEQARASYEATALNALREANDALAGVRTARDEVVAEATQATRTAAGARSRASRGTRLGCRRISTCSTRSGACSARSWR